MIALHGHLHALNQAALALGGDRVGRITSLDGSKFVADLNGLPLAALSHHDYLPSFSTDAELSYIADGDVVVMRPGQQNLRVLFRATSRHNAFLLTENCNHRCLMCSQPPKDREDHSQYHLTLAAIPFLPASCESIGITGGEPTTQPELFLEVMKSLAHHLPNAESHILSNGRAFRDSAFSKLFAEVIGRKSMVGIPIYSHSAQKHDYVVQAPGAFSETIRGIYGLVNAGGRVEIRNVLTRANIDDLIPWAEFLARNLTFVEHVAIMGMEPQGYAKARYDELTLLPREAAKEIDLACSILSSAGIHVSVYNRPLCHLEPRTRRFAVDSISDWKKEFLPDCQGCSLKSQCSGFFFSHLRRPPEVYPQ